MVTGYFCEFLGIKRDRITFYRNQWGKPFLSEDIKWQGSFNITHSKNWVICGISPSQRIGVDVEEIKNMNPDLLNFCFTEKELLQFKENPQGIITPILQWTLKESYLKAIGKGLHEDINSFEIIMQNDSFKLQDINGNSNNSWHFDSMLWNEEYYLSICLDRPFEFPNVRIIKLEEILSWL